MTCDAPCWNRSSDTLARMPSNGRGIGKLKEEIRCFSCLRRCGHDGLQKQRLTVLHLGCRQALKPPPVHHLNLHATRSTARRAAVESVPASSDQDPTDSRCWQRQQRNHKFLMFLSVSTTGSSRCASRPCLRYVNFPACLEASISIDTDNNNKNLLLLVYG